MPDTLKHPSEDPEIKKPSKIRKLLYKGLVSEVTAEVRDLMIPAHNYLTIEEFFLDFSKKLRALKIKGMQLPNIEVTAIRQKASESKFVRISDRHDFEIPTEDTNALINIVKGSIVYGPSGSIYISYEGYTIAITGIPLFHKQYADESPLIQDVIVKVKDRISDVIKNIQEISTDRLTGLLNKSGVDNGIMRLSKPKKDVVTIVLFLDGNNFKEINDTYGHEFGDNIIRQMGVHIKNQFPRATDIVGRNGGDEFIVIFNLETRNMRALLLIIEKIQKLKEGISFYDSSTGLSTDHTCTVGFGYCNWGNEPKNENWKTSLGIQGMSGTQTIKDAIGSADANMYFEKAKRPRSRK